MLDTFDQQSSSGTEKLQMSFTMVTLSVRVNTAAISISMNEKPWVKSKSLQKKSKTLFTLHFFHRWD